MKEFSVTVKVENSTDVPEALKEATAYMQAFPGMFYAIEVDDSVDIHGDESVIITRHA